MYSVKTPVGNSATLSKTIVAFTLNTGNRGFMADGVRVDVWLWSVRIYKTRSSAKSAAAAGNVRVDGAVVKPAKLIRPGQTVTARTRGRVRIVEVVEMHSKRVGAEVAQAAYVDHSPPPEPRTPKAGPAGVRDRGAGRPTKRDRRQIDKLQGR